MTQISLIISVGPSLGSSFEELWTVQVYTAASLGIDKMKKLVKTRKQMKMIKLVIKSLRSVRGSLGN